jgi:hypothetical protein
MRVLQTVTFSYARYLPFVFLSAGDLLVCCRLLSGRATHRWQLHSLLGYPTAREDASRENHHTTALVL